MGLGVLLAAIIRFHYSDMIVIVNVLMVSFVVACHISNRNNSEISNLIPDSRHNSIKIWLGSPCNNSLINVRINPIRVIRMRLGNSNQERLRSNNSMPINARKSHKANNPRLHSSRRIKSFLRRRSNRLVNMWHNNQIIHTHNGHTIHTHSNILSSRVQVNRNSTPIIRNTILIDRAQTIRI